MANTVMKTLGENLHPQYTYLGASVPASGEAFDELKNQLVLFNSALVRGVDKKTIDTMIGQIMILLLTNNIPDDMFVQLMILTAYQRDIKDGKGERDIFYHVVFRLWDYLPDAVAVLLNSVIGSPLASYKDVLLMIEKIEATDPTESQKNLSNLLFKIMLDALREDKALLDAGKKPQTLVFKWAPRQQTHFDKKLKLANRFAYKLFLTETNHRTIMAKYRRMLSAGSKQLETVEYYMCGGKWSLIDPAKIPAKAMKVYRKAFMNVDKNGSERSDDPERKNFAEKLVAFLNSGKTIHGATLMPHEIITHLRKNYDQVLDAQLKDMVDTFVSSFPSDIGLVLAMCDVSGSMNSRIFNANCTNMDVSIALGFLLSRLPGPFFDKLLTFSADPIIIDLSDKDSNYEKIKKIEKIWDGNSTSTDFHKAMNYIRRSLVDNKVDPATVQDLTLVVFSDMQFDRAIEHDNWAVAHDRIEAEYKKDGFSTPRMVYWNLAARTNTGHPAHAETKGVTMLSGFSAGALKNFLAGDIVPTAEPDGTVTKVSKTPYEVLCASLDRYVWLMKKFEESGVFPGYVAPKDDAEPSMVAPVE